MNQKQDNTITMFETTLVILDKNNSVWKGTGAFADAVTRAKDGTAAIRSRTGQQQAPLEGVTGEKAQLRDDLEDKLLVIADAIAAFAAKTADPALAAQVETNRSLLDRLPASDLVQTAQRIFDAAADHIGVLADYGVTEPIKDELKGAMELFANKKEGPREALIGRKVETISLPIAIREVRSIFRNELDKMMTSFRKAKPDFYQAYFAARIIVDRAATHPAKEPAPAPAPGP
jgi:maltose-binding protein MalE